MNVVTQMANMGVVIKNKDYLQLLQKGGAVRALEPGEVLVVELGTAMLRYS